MLVTAMGASNYETWCTTNSKTRFIRGQIN